jgi:hypothetical protein
LADAKTFEQHHVYGFAVNTGNTIQTENEFFEIQWTDLDFVLKSLESCSKTTILKPSKWNYSFIKLFKRNCLGCEKPLNKDCLGYSFKVSSNSILQLSKIKLF